MHGRAGHSAERGGSSPSAGNTGSERLIGWSRGVHAADVVRVVLQTACCARDAWSERSSVIMKVMEEGVDVALAPCCEARDDCRAG
eukprot:6232934-Alexandrium_andersonii.AAC.1